MASMRSALVQPAITHRLPLAASRRHAAVVVRAQSKSNGGVRRYLSEAVASIFGRLDNSSVDWSNTSHNFEGRISHDDHARLRTLYDVVKRVRGCTDPNATNYNSAANQEDGSCVYMFDDGGKPIGFKGSVGDYMQTAVSRVFAHHFKGDGTEPDWELMPFSGDIKSQRDIDRMVKFESVLKKTLDSASKKNEPPAAAKAEEKPAAAAEEPANQ